MSHACGSIERLNNKLLAQTGLLQNGKSQQYLQLQGGITQAVLILNLPERQLQ